MTLANKALWVIERNLDRPLTLAGIADSCGVSRYHLAHAFGETTRAERDAIRSRAAAQRGGPRPLANGAPDILELALETGYSSHEAFTRAFRAQFGATPETVRSNKSTEDLPMTKAIKIADEEGAKPAAPRFASGAPMLVVGLAERQNFAAPQAIPGQWQKFMALTRRFPTRCGRSQSASA